MSQRLNLFRGKEPCEQCGSRRFFLQDGLTYCQNGHQQQIATQIEVADDGRGLARKTRKRKETVEKVSRVYRGASAKELFLQAYQIILWKQCSAFIHIIGLPSELEDVVKNLWALRLQLLKDKVDATPNEQMVFSSQLPASDSEQGDDVNKGHKSALHKAMPSLMDSLALCYLGMILLRLPVSVGDLYRWAIREDVPFIRAIRFVPAIIREKLPAEYSLMLDTTSPLERDQIGTAVNNLDFYYRHHFAINLPPLNAPLLLYKYIRELALPSNLFQTVQHMAALLAIDFKFQESGRYVWASSSPETSLVSLLVIAVKLYHPFDNLRRSVLSLNDSAALQIDWSKWTEAFCNHRLRIHAGSHLVRGTEMHVTEEDAMRMSNEQLDDYLDWYERTWIDEDRARHKQRPLDEDFRKWFPTGRQDGSLPACHDFGEHSRKEQQSIQQLSADVMQTMMLRDVIPEGGKQATGEDATRIGSHYRRYRSSDDLAADALAFHEAVANAAGMKLETLLRAVLQVEQKFLNWRRLKPKERPQGKKASTPVHHGTGGSSDAAGTRIDMSHNDGNYQSSSE